MQSGFQLVKVADAVKPLGFDNEHQLYRVIRENQFPVPSAILRFGKQIRINLIAVEEAMKPQNVAAQKAAA
jgi:hypothetical protein